MSEGIIDIVSLTQGGFAVPGEIDIIEVELYSRLSGDPMIADLIEGRVYPVAIPQSPTYPLIRFARTSGVRIPRLLGASLLARPQFQIDAIAKTYGEAKTLAYYIRNCLEGFLGKWGNINISCVELLSDQDIYDDEDQTFIASADFEVWHNEANPTFA